MKKTLVLGATGRIGQLVVQRLKPFENIQQTIYIRNQAKLATEDMNGVNVLTGDVLDTERLADAMQGQDIVVAVLSGDLLKQAKSIVAAVKQTAVSRLIWVTGMGIHHEVPGETGKMLDLLVAQFPEYVQAADAIVGAGVPYTLIRAAHLTDGTNQEYYLQKEGEPLHSEKVDRCTVAQFIVDMVTSENGLGENESLGITN